MHTKTILEKIRADKINKLHASALNYYNQSLNCSQKKKNSKLIHALYLEKEAAFLEPNEFVRSEYFKNAASIAKQLASLNELKQLMNDAQVCSVIPEVTIELEQLIKEVENLPEHVYHSPWYSKAFLIFE